MKEHTVRQKVDAAVEEARAALRAKLEELGVPYDMAADGCAYVDDDASGKTWKVILGATEVGWFGEECK